MTMALVFFSFCDLPEITEEALTRELAATGGEEAADVGPFYKQYHCIFGFVAQTCYVCVPCFPVSAFFLLSQMTRACAAVRKWASPPSL